jgi:hypothetical protein
MTGRAAAIQESFARKWRFEAAHLEVRIIVPEGLADPWRAVMPAGAPEGSGGNIEAGDLDGLMDQLEEIYPDCPPDGNPREEPAPRGDQPVDGS